MNNTQSNFLINAHTFLDYLDNIEKSIEQGNINNSNIVKFWRGLVRDSDGRWNKFHTKGVKYFKAGTQYKIDLENQNQVLYIKSSISHIKAFVQGLIEHRFEDFENWITKLHHYQNYYLQQPVKLKEAKTSKGEHSEIVKSEILPLAIKYNDSYSIYKRNTVKLPNIPSEGFPVDVWQNEDIIFHYYPNLQYLHHYTYSMTELLRNIVQNDYDENTIPKIALYYQYGINIHMFENINQSLFANQMNALLTIYGFNPINHGILDFVAMRLQPENFILYFIDEVKRAQQKTEYIP